MLLSQLDYFLPKNLIAQTPVSPRDHSNLMVIDREKNQISHHKFFEIAEILTSNDILVFNKTKVFPARIYGIKTTGGKVEILLIKEEKSGIWQAMYKGKLKEGDKISFNGFWTTVQKLANGICYLKFNIKSSNIPKKLKKIGHTPLPPYIHSKDSEASLRKKYQTVYAQDVGSVAAPTAGFHFTKNLLMKLKAKGVQMEYVTLHVGLGTFLPIKEETVENHHMHSEYFEVDKETLKHLNEAKLKGKRIIAVGTTANRVLETLATENCKLRIENLKSSTELFIYPPYKFNFVDAIITNFHLPHSTLLSLVSAFVSYPNSEDHFTDFKSSLMGKAYQEAIKKRYRFYSFGDSSLIV
jgi:S-adenosylmethionine:tRNA ribosyltransferase-isomerase